ncbi:heterokaryon incompatibility protein-domain-containing protein [Biscogniauxia marginata]|nr:heterokaryon incompatibility protein-domain-containing protein [Biscogniauxia marginata]
MLSRHTQPSLNLIDCGKQEVVSCSSFPSDFVPEYVALSYVWGRTANMSEVETKGPTLPQSLSKVIQDAMKAVTSLGYRYLWVDKYCVDQHDTMKKREQIMHMDSVYQDAVLTIIAAAGTDESYGLPGFSRLRSSQYISFQGVHFTLMSALPSPRTSIAKSMWSTRGWTYQEAVLSSRRLVFVDEQLYFECNNMCCYESVHVSFDRYYADPKPKPELDAFVIPTLFSLRPPKASALLGDENSRLESLRTYLHCASQYSKRKLTFDNDALSAFSGIIRKLQSMEVFPVRHIWGVPLFYLDDSLSTDTLQSADSVPTVPPFRKMRFLSLSSGLRNYYLLRNEQIDCFDSLMLDLCWWHGNESPTRPRRRKDIPSWSWAGWEGAVTWPSLSNDSCIWKLTPTETTVRLKGSSTQAVLDTYYMSGHAPQQQQNTKLLQISTVAVSPDAFTFERLRWMRLYSSKTDLDEVEALRLIWEGLCEALPLVTIDRTAYFMLVEKCHNSASYYRVGIVTFDTFQLAGQPFTPHVKTYTIE